MLIFWRLDIFGVVGVGWGKNVLFDFYSIASALALPHIRHATLLDVLLHFHTYVMLRCWMFTCTSTHTSCYACWMFSCASTHTRYAAGCSLALLLQCPEQPRPTFCLKPKKKLFGKTLGEQNCSFVLVKN